MLTETELEGMAKAMAKAYAETRNRENAVVQTMNEFPNGDIAILRAMWEAIDWYVDANE